MKKRLPTRRSTAFRITLVSCALVVLAGPEAKAQPRNLKVGTDPLAPEYSITLPGRECQGVPATGALVCSSADGTIIDCAGTGQDAEYQLGLTTGEFPRFTDNGKGVVLDNLTGLVWAKNADCFGRRTWMEALSLAGEVSDVNCVADGSEAGDWRLPNIKELHSLVDYGRAFPAINVDHPFADVEAYYWSSTTSVAEPEEAWTWWPGTGLVGSQPKTQNSRFVWPVRRMSEDDLGDYEAVLPDRKCQGVPATGQTDCYSVSGTVIPCAGTGQDGEVRAGFTVAPHPRFTDNADGTVTDNLTGLIWLQDTACFVFHNWEDNLALAAGLSDGTCGLTDGSAPGDWRMPNVNELRSLLDYGYFQQALPEPNPFTGVNVQFHTSTSRADSPQGVWYVTTSTGGSNAGSKFGGSRLWPVRGGR